jgi:hypothetical protein
MIAASQTSFAHISDLPEYYAASKMAASSRGAGIYRLDQLGSEQQKLFPAMGERAVGFYVPPPALVWLLPLSVVPLSIVPAFWSTLLVAALIAAIAILSRLFQLNLVQSLAIWSVAAISGPLYESIRIGQPAPLLLLALCAAVAALRADRCLLAALAMSFLFIKPQELLPFLVYLAGARRYRPLAALLGIAGVFVAFSLLAVGVEGYTNYFQLLFDSVGNTANMQPELTPTLRGQLLRLLPGSKWLATGGSSLACLAVLAFIWLSGRRYARYRQWLEIGLVIAVPAGLVSALHCHDYDLLLLIPVVVAVFKLNLLATVPEAVKLLIIAGSTMLLLPLYKYIHYDYLLAGGPFNPIFAILLVAAVGLPFLVHNSRLELLLDEKDDAV